MTKGGTADCDELKVALSGKATNYVYRDVARWLQRANFSLRSSRGSHRVWGRPGSAVVQLVEKGAGALLPVYVKRAAQTLWEVLGCE